MIAYHPSSVYNIVGKLVEQKLLDLETLSETSYHACNLVFAIIGWQTMLFRPDLHSCSVHEIGILDETAGYRGRSHSSLRQGHSAFNKPLNDLLLGFGMMLPPSNFSLTTTDLEANSLGPLATFRTSAFNAHLLGSISKIRFEWTAHGLLSLRSTDSYVKLSAHTGYCLAEKRTPVVVFGS